MNLSEKAVRAIDEAQEYFLRSTRNLEEQHSSLAPAPGMMTAAQQVAHAAQTIEWFLDGAFSPGGFDLDFDAHMRAVAEVRSLAEARAWFGRACDAARAKLRGLSDEDLLTRIADGPVMGGAPRIAIASAVTDHTAHHRGALTVYARLAGVVPPMPYMDV